MQHAVLTRFTGIVVSLFVAGSALAVDTTKAWSAIDDYVKREAVNASNQHPVTFSAEQLRNLLSRVYKQVDSKPAERYLTDDEIERLSNSLLPEFVKAQTGDDILFASSFRPGGMFFNPRALNAGRMFVENGQLNIVIGMCGASQDMTYLFAYGQVRALNHGSRAKTASRLDCQLLTGNGVKTVNNRPDWVQIDISRALAAPAPANFEGVAGTTFKPASDAQATTFKPAVLTPPAEAGSDVAPAKVVAPAPVAAPAPAPQAPASAPAAPLSKAEERLLLLKRLKDNGLINDAEYEQKRAAIVKDL